MRRMYCFLGEVGMVVGHSLDSRARRQILQFIRIVEKRDTETVKSRVCPSKGVPEV